MCPALCIAASSPTRSTAVRRQSNPAELPARVGREEVAIGGPDVRSGRCARAATQHELIAHELRVVLSQRTLHRAIPGIGEIGAAGPLPHVAKELRRPIACDRMEATTLHKIPRYRPLPRANFPLRLGR